MTKQVVFLLMLTVIVSAPMSSRAAALLGAAKPSDSSRREPPVPSDAVELSGQSPFAASAFLAGDLFASSEERFLTDARVKEQLEYFMTSGKPIFQDWLDRSAPFLPFMKAIFRGKKLPEDLVYVAMIESGLRFHAVSRSRAVGPWQFMPETAKRYGLVMNEWIDERRDPVKSTRAAAAHLKSLYRRFGSWHLALASYNAGAGKIRRALLRSPEKGLPGLYGSRTIREETKNYVPKLVAAIIIAKDPEQYGFTLKSRGAFRYEVVRIDKSMDLRVIAALAECAVADIRALNPEIAGWATPPYIQRYQLRVPPGTNKHYRTNLLSFSGKRSLGSSRSKTLCRRVEGSRRYEYALLTKKAAVRYDVRTYRLPIPGQDDVGQPRKAGSEGAVRPRFAALPMRTSYQAEGQA